MTGSSIPFERRLVIGRSSNQRPFIAKLYSGEQNYNFTIPAFLTLAR